MQAPPGKLPGPVLLALLKEGTLAGDWVLDPRRSSVRLKSRSVWGLVPVNGVFREVSGSGTVSRNGSASRILTVAAASIDTGNTQRDTHLRSADFFDSANHPDITFTAGRIRPSGAGVAVTGALTVRDRTRPLSFGPAVYARRWRDLAQRRGLREPGGLRPIGVTHARGKNRPAMWP
jgi:polyisoprenoid-binding protein YceI